MKYKFVSKKKIFRENFSIEPKEGKIVAGETQKVKVIFQTNQELKLQSGSKPDIVLEILEGSS